MERNTYATSIYVDVPLADVQAYLSDGMSLNEYTLFSRMKEQVDEHTWLGTASGYQSGLYYHVRTREFASVRIVEWHCGAEYGKYFHVYPMLLFPASYFGSSENGTYKHWISFVDPARRTQMIAEGLPVVHRSEARSFKAQLERRRGHRAPSKPQLELASHTIYVDAPIEATARYLADPARCTEWGYMIRRDGERLYDAYDREIAVTLKQHDFGPYQVVEHDTRYLDTGEVVRTPIVLVPAAYAFAQPAATGVIMHRITGWPVEGDRSCGKASRDDYDTEAINAKRIIEASVGNLHAYALGCSYAPAKG